MSIHPSRQAYLEEEQDDNAGILLADIRNLKLHEPSLSPSTDTDDTAATDRDYNLPAAGNRQTSDVLNEFARRRKAQQLAVPTDDQKVRAELRARGEPITLFGEKREDRRDRLRALMLKEEEEGHDDTSMRDLSQSSDSEEETAEVEEEFYTEGSQALLEARRAIAWFSLPRAAKRIAYQKRESKITVQTHVQHRKQIKSRLAEFDLFGSQIASERPVSIVRFAPQGNIVACGDWGGSVRLLDVPNLEPKVVLQGHKSIVGGITWRPEAMPTLEKDDGNERVLELATSGGDGNVNLWNSQQDSPLSTLSGHTDRVVRTEFHPCGQYLASASYDTTWRLWDVAVQKELLVQEGHSKEVYALGFNLDGSLITTAGLDSIGRVWDLRTGRTIMLLESHVAPIHGVDWSPDGYRCATGSSDGFIKVWDLRNVRESASIGAHSRGVSDLRWYKGTDHPLSDASPTLPSPNGKSNGTADSMDVDADAAHDSEDPPKQPKKAGTFLISTGFDKAVNIFSADDWPLCKTLTGHDGIVLAADVTADAAWIASCGRDRTVKLWARGMGGEAL